MVEKRSEEFIVCPYCEREHDTTDYEADGNFRGKTTCDSCGKEFRFEVDFAPTWYTETLENET